MPQIEWTEYSPKDGNTWGFRIKATNATDRKIAEAAMVKAGWTNPGWVDGGLTFECTTKTGSLAVAARPELLRVGATEVQKLSAPTERKVA